MTCSGLADAVCFQKLAWPTCTSTEADDYETRGITAKDSVLAELASSSVLSESMPGR